MLKVLSHPAAIGQTIGSAPPASDGKNTLRTPHRFHPGKFQNNARRAERAKRALHTGDVVSAFAVMPMPSLLVTPREEIKRSREQLIECDDEIRDLRYRMHLRGYNLTLW